jgi:CRP/FNR family transcriptional regulator, cyclic AMP receptor protein
MDSQSSLIDRLKTVKHFSSLSPGELWSIVSAGSVKRYGTGQTIFCEGDACAGMFVLIRGRVQLCKFGLQGQVNIMSVVEPVIMFNEVAVLDGGPNPVTAIAAEDSLLWQIDHQAFQDLLKKIPVVGLSLLRVLAARNRQMLDHYEDLSFRSVLSRTAKFLLDISECGRRPIDRRMCSIEEMARRIATVPEAISRSLSSLKSTGAIQVSRTEILITSEKKLSELAQLKS